MGTVENKRRSSINLYFMSETIIVFIVYCPLGTVGRAQNQLINNTIFWWNRQNSTQSVENVRPLPHRHLLSRKCSENPNMRIVTRSKRCQNEENRHSSEVVEIHQHAKFHAIPYMRFLERSGNQCGRTDGQTDRKRSGLVEQTDGCMGRKMIPTDGQPETIMLPECKGGSMKKSNMKIKLAQKIYEEKVFAWHMNITRQIITEFLVHFTSIVISISAKFHSFASSLVPGHIDTK